MIKEQYILDTNAVIELMREPTCLVARRLVENGGVDYCAISDITLYELYAGAFSSQKAENNVRAVEQLTSWLKVIPSATAYREAARQKAALRNAGQLIEDIDILIGSTAIETGRILVTQNEKHMKRLQGIRTENWNK